MPPPLPSLTFAIPFRSDAELLRRTIQSLLAQDDVSWTAFVSDNASSEPGIAERVGEWGRGRVGYLRNPTDIEMAGNFNRCIDLASSDLVTLLHSDDEIDPGYCGLMRSAASRHPETAAFFCGATIIGVDSQPIFSLPDLVKRFINPAFKREAVLRGESGVRALLAGNFIIAPSLCFQKRVLGARRWSSGYSFILDWELTTQLLLDGDSIVGLPQKSYRYRRHPGSATEELTRTFKRFHEELGYYLRMREIVDRKGWSACVRVAERKHLLKLNLLYRTLSSAARLRFTEARQSLSLLRSAQ